MMDQKDTLLDKMSHVFKEKDSIITELKHQLHNTSFDSKPPPTNPKFRHIKRRFQPSPSRRPSNTQSDRSLNSLVYLIQKTNEEQPKIK